jgi:hypothetical protein
MHFFRDGQFELHIPESSEIPEVDSSMEWYRGWRGHLGFATVRRGLPRNAVGNATMPEKKN